MEQWFKTKIKLTLETETFKQSWESFDENEDLESLCQAFFGLCIASGWDYSYICEKMLDFIQDKKKDLNKGKDES